MDIGTAKVEAEICKQVPHHLLDVANIGEVFSAGSYSTLAEQAIKVYNLYIIRICLLVCLFICVRIFSREDVYH